MVIDNLFSGFCHSHRLAVQPDFQQFSNIIHRRYLQRRNQRFFILVFGQDCFGDNGRRAD